MSRGGLTPAQAWALVVLVKADDWVRGGKRSSTLTPIPYVNMRAADALVRAGLAEARLGHPSGWSAYVHDTTYRATDAGKAVVA